MMAKVDTTISQGDIVEGEISTSPSLPNMICPHCGHKSRIRSSTQITPIYRDIYYLCQNIVCGFSWKASLTLVHGISPSACPRPELDLPMYEVTKPALPAPKPEDRQHKFEI
jgi:hypothetical protein